MENNTCEGGNCSGCHGMMGHGCCGWKKCHMIKKIIWIIIVVVAFCLGTQLGELKSMARYNGFDGRGMMNWGYYNDGSDWKSVKVDNGSTTPTTPNTKTTPKQ